MAITFVNKATANTDSVAIPTHQAGDLIIVMVCQRGDTTQPSKPAASGTVPAWKTMTLQTAGSCAMGIYYFQATASTTTSGTWLNSTNTTVLVYRPDLSYYGMTPYNPTNTTGVGRNVSYSSKTSTHVSGNGLIGAIAFHRSSSALETPPSGLTLRSNLVASGESASFDSNTDVDFAGDIVDVGSAGTSSWITSVFEIKQEPPHGDVATTEDNDTSSSVGKISLSATADYTEGDDTVSSTGILPLAATATMTEADDLPYITGMQAPLEGSFSAIEANDTLTSAGNIQALTIGIAVIVEGNDTVSSATKIAIKSVNSITENNDTLSTTGGPKIAAVANIVEQGDTANIIMIRPPWRTSQTVSSRPYRKS